MLFVGIFLPQALVAGGSGRVDFMSGFNVGQLTMDHGLPHNHITNIIRDDLGFIWLATSGGGISRYDGNEFINFNLSSTEFPIVGNFAVEFATDKFNRLWVATEGGLSIIDIFTLKSLTLEDASGKFDKVERSVAWSVSTDNRGRIWTQTNEGIYCVDFDEEGNVASVASMFFSTPPSTTIKIRDILDCGKPLAGINGRVCTLDAEVDTIKILNTLPEPYLANDEAINDIVLYNGDLWVATNIGLMRYNMARNIGKSYQSGNARNTLSQDFVSTLSITPDGRLIAGTLRGFSVYNPISDDFERIYDSESGINGNFINKIYAENHRIWICTDGCGLKRLSPKRLSSTFVGQNNSRSAKIAPLVNAIHVDDDRSIWIGTVEGGLHRANSFLTNIEHYTTDDGVISHNSVSALARDGRGRLWVGEWGGGIEVLATPSSSKPTHLKSLNRTTDNKFSYWYIGALQWDSINNLMWIGSSHGLFVYDLETERVTEAYPGSADEVYGALGSTIDCNGHLWLGSSRGLFDIDLNKYAKNRGRDAVRYISGRLRDSNSVADERITFILEDSRKQLWIGTNGNGLFRRETDANGTEVFINISTVEGLPNDIVKGIAEDGVGNVWVSTYRGLACILTTGQIVSFDQNGDLECDVFYWNAAASTPAGDVLFGSNDGLLAVHGFIARSDEHRNRINFTHVWVDDVEFSGGVSEGSTKFQPYKGLELHESARSVGFNFSAMDFDHISENRYEYLLEGFDSDWNDLPNERYFVRYTNLPAGKYTFKVRYTDLGSPEPIISEASLPVLVKPYFYRTWWFILILLIVLCAVGFVITLTRTRTLRLQSIMLQRQVNERTMQIEEQKRQVQRLTMDRISFFTNITHEFRTPITLILGPIERALKLSYNPQVIEQLNFVERNAKYLLSLVNQLMDFRKVESGKMEISRSRGNVKAQLIDIVEAFRPLVASRNIEIRLTEHLPLPIMNYDEAALQKVLINLLGNAVKFTPEGGLVTVRALLLPASYVGNDKGSLYLSVTDNGTGINPDELEQIFDRFYQGSSQIKYPLSGASGSGIGLYLCKSLVQLYGGNISARNNPTGKGCCFRVLLPIDPDDTPEAAPESRVGENLIEKVAPAPIDNVEGGSSGDRLTILVVEDNDDMRAFLRGILSENFNTAEARNGEEALKVLASREISMIVCDLMMPVMDGLELSRRVKESFEWSHIPFLMLTAKAGREPRLESWRSGVDEYILKPFDEELLIARIDNILRTRRRYQNHFVGHMQVENLNISEESRDKKFMDQVMKVINDNYRNSYFDIGDFAEALGVSRSLLNKKLQGIAGLSAGQLLRNFRLNTARELIIKNRKTHNLNISEIAYEVGFNDSKYFTRCFTKQFGVTPSAMQNS